MADQALEQEQTPRPEDTGKRLACSTSSKAGGEAVQELETRSTELRQQNQQVKLERNLTLGEQLQKNGTVKIGPITRQFGMSMEITDGENTVVKGRSSNEVSAAKQAEAGQAYKDRFGDDPDKPIGQVNTIGQAKPQDTAVNQAFRNETAPGSAEQTGKVTDYQPRQNNEHFFSLGMNYQVGTPPANEISDKLADFARAAARRATDPKGWQSWFDGEVKKVIGICEGLNEAKDETKAVTTAGFKALTDGTVANLLSRPDAINEPLFKTVASVFDAVSSDPNATNKALEALGNAVMQASNDYSNLPEKEQGKVIGKFAFGMINPEGSTEGAEVALKVANKVATKVDKAVWDTIDQTAKSLKNMGPEAAGHTKQMLFDYMKSKGLVGHELQYADVPKGFFDGFQPPEAGKTDNAVFSVSGKGDAAGDRGVNNPNGGMKQFEQSIDAERESQKIHKVHDYGLAKLTKEQLGLADQFDIFEASKSMKDGVQTVHVGFIHGKEDGKTNLAKFMNALERNARSEGALTLKIQAEFKNADLERVWSKRYNVVPDENGRFTMIRDLAREK